MPPEKFVIVHRGVWAYAPEKTLASYRLAIKQEAEYVEQDLQITRDGVLVCCHDLLLNRITNAPEIFPDSFKEEIVKGEKVKKWYIHDFTLKEIKQLDAGSSFDPKFKGEKIPTGQEAIEEIKGKAGLCPETKGREYYGKTWLRHGSVVRRSAQEKRSGETAPPQRNADFNPVVQHKRIEKTRREIRNQMAADVAHICRHEMDAGDVRRGREICGCNLSLQMGHHREFG